MNIFSKKIIGILLSAILIATSFIGIGNVFAETTDDLAGKTLLFVGDSISAGYKDEANADSSLKAWAKRLADDYQMEVTLAAQSGSPLSTIREPDRPAIVNQLHDNKNGSFDYVILQGGINDAMGTATDNSKEAAAPVGEMSDSFVNYSFDTSTFAGALENLFYYAKKYFPEAKVGFIITFATPLSTHGGYTAEVDSMRQYWNMAKVICEKWGVSYLDFFDGTDENGQSYSYDILKVDTTTNFYDGGYDFIHLNSAGYDLTALYIAQWLPTTTQIEYDDSNETFSGGSGTEADPYIITNETELALAITNGGAGEKYFGCHFSIANDIYLNDIDAADWKTGTVNEGYTLKPWYSQDETFAGTIDGNGHTVYGLYSYVDGKINYKNRTIGGGLIPATDSTGTATIKNLGIDYSYVRQRFCAGVIVGICGNSVVIDNCFVGSNTKVIGCYAGAIVGNGYQKTVTITNCYSLASFGGETASDYLYGLIGDAAQTKATVSNCYIVNGPITSTGNTAYATVFKFSNSYQTVECGSGGSQSEHTNVYTLTADNMQGEDVLSAETKMPGLNRDVYFATEGYPVLTSFVPDEEIIEIWDGTTIATEFAGGAGTEANPYLISNGSELALAITQSGTTTQTVTADDGIETTETVNELYFGKNFKLIKDIYLNEIDAVDWKSQTGLEQSSLNPWYNWSNGTGENFAGTLDGNNHTVYGIYSYRSGTNTNTNYQIGGGLIPATASNGTVTIKNLGIDCSYIRNQFNAGAIIGVCSSETTVSNCFVGKNVVLYGNFMGAIIGNSGKKTVAVTDCYSLCAFAAYPSIKAYGLIGCTNQSTVTFENCYNANGPLTSNTNSNGLTKYKFYNSYETVASGNATGSGTNIKTNVYLITNTANMQGLDVLKNADKMPYLALNTDGTVHTAYTATEGYPILKVFETTENPWDEIAIKPTKLDNNGRIVISSAAELAYVIKNGGGASYVLSNDIYLNDISKVDWCTGKANSDYVPMEWYTTENTTSFTGILDGNGYVVYGLYFVSGTPAATGSGNYTSDAVALIPSTREDKIARIKNLGIDYAYIKGSQCAAALVGNSNGTALKSVNGCFAGKNVTVIGHVTGGIFGGGDAELLVNNCYSLATLSATYSSGGILGYVHSTATRTVNNSYSFNFRPFSVADGIVSTNVYTNVGNTCEQYTVLTDDNMTGADALTYMSGFDSEIWYAVNNGQTTPLLRVHGTAVGDADENGVGKEQTDVAAVCAAIIGKYNYPNSDYDRNGEIDICDLVALSNVVAVSGEYSVIRNKLELPLNINTYRNASGNIGEAITISGPTGPWNYASFNVSNNETYGVKFYAYPNAESWSHIFLCNSEDVILETISADYPGRNYITFTVTNKDVSKVYVRSRTNNGEKEKIKVTQFIEGIDSVNMDTLGQLKFEIAPPKNYTAWPMTQEVGGKLVCLYTEADQHSFTECKLYMKTSSTNGLTWTAPKAILADESGARGITGTGKDNDGNMLIWYMTRNKDWSTKHTLYKTDGNTVTKVCAPDFSFTGGGHIGNIFSVPGEGLFAFYNTYGNTRSWGIVKSVDNGLTWEQIPVEQNIESAECPVEIDGFCHDGKILALGRKDKNSGTIAMFQIQSTDKGVTWTKEYTNITDDALGNSPSIIFDSVTEDIYMYYFDRNTGKLKRRTATFTGVWDNPVGWSEATVLVSEPYIGQDTGNAKTTAVNGMHFVTYYAGSSTTTGVYGMLIKP